MSKCSVECVTEFQPCLTHGRTEVQTKLSEGCEHATGNQGVWFGAYHRENSYDVLVFVLLLASPAERSRTICYLP